MSRSVKKNPVSWTDSRFRCKRLKSEKRRANQLVRRFDEEIANGNSYRKLDERINWSNGPKIRWEDPKAYRK